MKDNSYSVKQLADLAGVSSRTLHYYDQTGLLKPAGTTENGYRYYEEKELLRLQQILFYRELAFSLEEIKIILEKPDFDVLVALSSHRKLLRQQIFRLNKLVNTVDKTLEHLKGETEMQDQEYYGGFNKEHQEKYEGEILHKYGNTAINESKKRMGKWSKTDFARITAEGDKIFCAICGNMNKGAHNLDVQAQVKGLHQWLNNFYSCNLEMLEGIGQMYNDHPDFRKMFQTKYHQDMPEFLKRAIEHYCRHNQKTELY
jgi:DNA-binding transcriptional MerR regulator